LWKKGYTGKGRKFLSVDTGIWPEHPAIQNHFLARYQKLSSSWRGYDKALPGDKGNAHGTHTTGTVLGLDTATHDTIGVAFNAYFISADPIVSDLSRVRPYTDLLGSLQWALNPDGDTSTTNDIPDAINNSWGRNVSSADTIWCSSFIGPAFGGMAAAGIAVVFSAGNDGPNPGTTGLPAAVSNSLVVPFSIGALDGNNAPYTIANFSSRGPSLCNDTGAIKIKPEVSAPGVNVRSCIYDKQYALYSGTSMACPHTVGAVLLLKEAFPNLSGEAICKALYFSATDLGSPGEDNVYGRGLIDIEAAYNYLITLGNSPTPPAVMSQELSVGDARFSNMENGFTCLSNTSATIKYYNRGTTTINSINVQYGNGVLNQTTTINRAIAPGGIDSITIPSINLQYGANDIMVKITPSTWANEYDTINNQRVYRVNCTYQAGRAAIAGTPVIQEDFSNIIPDNTIWTIRDFDRVVQWDTATVKPYGRSMVIRCGSYTPKGGQLDELLSPSVSFDQLNAGNGITYSLSFSYSYRNKFSNFKDSLFIYASPDCGNTWIASPIYANGGTAMRTRLVDTPSTAAHWRDTSVSFSSLANQLFQAGNKVMFKFVSKNDFGGDIYIDNIQLLKYNYPTGVLSPSENRISVYPNPGNSDLTIFSDEALGMISLISMDGKTVYEKSLEDIDLKHNVPTSSLSDGIYIVQCKSSKGVQSIRWIKTSN
jgi:bacillopeptidase F